MEINPVSKKRMRAYVPPWLIIGSAVILLIVVVILAVRNTNREKTHMSNILSEKGEALIKSFEAGARTGMMGMSWGGNQVQTLLEEVARQPGILYLVVTDENGKILAHNDRSKIGRQFLSKSEVHVIAPENKAKWRITDSNSGRSFEVYQNFRLLDKAVKTGKRASRWMCDSEMMGARADDWCFPNEPGKDRQIIFVGLDVLPFEAARAEDLRNTVIISSVLLLLGLGGLFSLFIAQSFRATRQKLQDTSAFAEKAVSNLPVGLIAVGREGLIDIFNDVAERITGLQANEVLRKPPDNVLPGVLSNVRKKISGGEKILEMEMDCPLEGGKHVPVSVSATQIINEEGSLVGDLLILKDLVEVRQLQKDIRRKEKQASLGRLAAGVAHEIRNPLSSIKGLASYFRDKSSQGSEDMDAATVMIQEVDRLNRAITELLEFARPTSLSLRPQALDEVLEHSLRLVRLDAKSKNIKVQVTLGKDLPRVVVDSDRLSQCLLNLYLNALQAMDPGGELSIRSYETNHSIAVEISDTGPGIAIENIDKIFDPYFTTKGSGTGLGLAVVQKIIEGHQGKIQVHSKPGKGSTFIITFPALSGQDAKGDGHGET